MPPTTSSSRTKKYIPVDQKLEIVQDYLKSNGSAYSIAKKHNVQTSQVIQWAKIHDKLKATAESDPKKLTVNAGPAIAKPNVEKAVLEYFEELRDNDLAVSTKMVIVKAKSIDSTFHGGNIQRLTYW
ncbi:unnamed protein product, partial [Aphanomyces euteiches]